MKLKIKYKEGIPEADYEHYQQALEYFKTLKAGERVVECGISGLYGRKGTTYFSKNDGSLCVLWDERKGEGGQMGTLITGGTRRLEDVELIYYT
jgi:hypothetical protein